MELFDKPYCEDSIVNSVIRKFKSRSDFGIVKYGKTLDRDDLSILDWLNHAQEEHMDAILYLEKVRKMEMEKRMEIESPLFRMEESSSETSDEESDEESYEESDEESYEESDEENNEEKEERERSQEVYGKTIYNLNEKCEIDDDENDYDDGLIKVLPWAMVNYTTEERYREYIFITTYLIIFPIIVLFSVNYTAYIFSFLG